MYNNEISKIFFSDEKEINEIIYNPNKNNIILLSSNKNRTIDFEGNLSSPMIFPDEVKIKKIIHKSYFHPSRKLFTLNYDESICIFNLNSKEMVFQNKYKADEKIFAINKPGTMISFKEDNNKLQIIWLGEKKKKTVKIDEKINDIVFSPDSVNYRFLLVIGEDILVIPYDTGKIASKMFFSGKKGIFTSSGDRLFILGKETNTIRIYQTHKLDSNPKMLNEIYPKLRSTQTILLTPDNRILVALSPDGIELWDITIPEQEISLIWTKKVSNFVNGFFLPNGQLVTSSASRELSLWNESFLLEDIREIFKNFADKIEEIKIDLRRIPQWVIDGDIKNLGMMELENIERNLNEVKKIVDPPIISRFQPPNFPYWVDEVFSDEIAIFTRIEANSNNSITLLDQEVTKQHQQLQEKLERYQRIVDRCIFYLKSFAHGTKVQTEQISNYLSISSEETIKLLNKLEREKKLPPGRLVSNLFGRLDFISGYETVGTNHLIERSDSFSCYYCANSINSIDTHCTNCQKEILRCKSCNVPVTRNQEKIDCNFCKETFHYLCYKGKVKIFHRCPHCKTEITKEQVEIQFYSDNKKNAQISSSLGRMLQIKKNIKKEEKNPFDF
ncbi:MAG: hypothetical protein HeimC3_12510 [Candidatus Heimdallarchaeota archaeon LC_3]|nr:MAG: hypothetical protein HeimC3_12510 [Candidatus Heimdallarchaeota archaeon LC_3]